MGIIYNNTYGSLIMYKHLKFTATDYYRQNVTEVLRQMTN